jgi:hypothetical protein
LIARKLVEVLRLPVNRRKIRRAKKPGKIPACGAQSSMLQFTVSAKDVCDHKHLTTDLRLRLLSNSKLVISRKRTRFEARPHRACPKAFR